MNIPKFANVNRRHLSIAMIVLVVVLLCDVAYQMHMHAKWRRWIPATLASPAAATQPATTQGAGTQGGKDASAADTQPTSTSPTATRPTETQRATTQAAGTQPTTTQATTTQSAQTKPAKRRGPKKSPPGQAKKKKRQKPPEIHAAIKKRNLFAKPGPKGHGMTLTGVLGNIAIFQDRGKKRVEIEEGKSSKGIKLKSIKGYEVVIEYKGKQETLKLTEIKGAAVAGGGPGRPGLSMRVPPGQRGKMPAEMPAEVKERMKARMKSMRRPHREQ